MSLLKHIPSWIKNKYLLTAVVFATWICFFDEQDIFTTHFKHKRELHKLEESRDYYVGQIEGTKKELEQLKSDPATLEKYAREKYWMKRENEDLYILPESQPADK